MSIILEALHLQNVFDTVPRVATRTIITTWYCQSGLQFLSYSLNTNAATALHYGYCNSSNLQVYCCVTVRFVTLNTGATIHRN